MRIELAAICGLWTSAMGSCTRLMGMSLGDPTFSDERKGAETCLQ
jgi:hypothetical protein